MWRLLLLLTHNCNNNQQCSRVLPMEHPCTPYLISGLQTCIHIKLTLKSNPFRLIVFFFDWFVITRASNQLGSWTILLLNTYAVHTFATMGLRSEWHSQVKFMITLEIIEWIYVWYGSTKNVKFHVELAAFLLCEPNITILWKWFVCCQ